MGLLPLIGIFENIEGTVNYGDMVISMEDIGNMLEYAVQSLFGRAITELSAQDKTPDDQD